jgi:hypothetical protein
MSNFVAYSIKGLPLSDASLGKASLPGRRFDACTGHQDTFRARAVSQPAN